MNHRNFCVIPKVVTTSNYFMLYFPSHSLYTSNTLVIYYTTLKMYKMISPHRRQMCINDDKHDLSASTVCQVLVILKMNKT